MQKSTLHKFTLFIFFLWIAAFLVSLIALAFPNSSIFNMHIPIQVTKTSDQEGSLNLTIIDRIGILDMESLQISIGDHFFRRVYSKDPRYLQEATFFVENSKNNTITGIIYPLIGDGPAQSDFRAEIRLKTFSPQNIGRITILLGVGLIFGFKFLRKNSSSANPNTAIQNKGFQIPGPYGFRAFSNNNSPRLFSKKLILNSIALVLTITFGLILSEWVFLITKSSFMDGLFFSEKFRVLMISFFLLSHISLLVLAIFYATGILVSHFSKTAGIYLTQIPAALLITFLIILLVDNFFLSIFRSGIASSETIGRFLLSIAVFIVFVFFLIKSVERISSLQSGKPQKIWLAFIFGFFLICAIISIYGFDLYGIPKANSIGKNQPSQKLNIILISSDGLNAENLSLYGYTRDTTPFLRELKKTSLVGENHFTNSSHSLGSETSLLTGKLPLTTGVILSPDILKGLDKFNHLPGILNRAGYYSISLGIPYYVDAEILDFHDAFMQINCGEIAKNYFPDALSSHFGNELYFLYQIQRRIFDRISHVFFFIEMPNFKTPTEDAMGNINSDQSRLNCLEESLDTAIASGKPLFAQIHQISTHGPIFESPYFLFSNDGPQTNLWMTDYYDDSILYFDSQISNLVGLLKSRGVFNNTILVVYTDHGAQNYPTSRVPLLIHFPNDKYFGTITNNSQNLDIAATILDYLQIEIPSWMEGSSLLKPIDENRIQFTFDPVEPIFQEGFWAIPSDTNSLPYNQFKKINAIQCQIITSIDLSNGQVVQSFIPDYSQPCPTEKIRTQEDILDTLDGVLIERGYPSLQEQFIEIQ